MKTQVILAAAGRGIRLRKPVAKALVLLNGKPLLIYSLQIFDQHPLMDSIIVAASRENIPDFWCAIEKYNIQKVKKVISGGKTRCESVKKCLAQLDADTKCVLIHDCARPFVNKSLIDSVIQGAAKFKAAVLAVPVKPTIKEVNSKTMMIKKTLKRSDLWEVQTPQAFAKDVLLKAHRQNKNLNATDDAVLVEKLGVKVKIVEGDYHNIKITTEEDLVLAQAFLANQPIRRTPGFSPGFAQGCGSTSSPSRAKSREY